MLSFSLALRIVVKLFFDFGYTLFLLPYGQETLYGLDSLRSMYRL